MQTMIDPTALALRAAAGALVLGFGVAGALWRHSKNTETALTDFDKRLSNLGERLSTELLIERRLNVLHAFGISKTANTKEKDISTEQKEDNDIIM